MVRAALRKGLCPRQLSFKGALQAVNGFTPALVLAEGAVVDALLDALLGSVAAHRVGQRPIVSGTILAEGVSGEGNIR